MTVYHRIIIKNQQGMHARPAIMLCELIQQFESTVLLRNCHNIEAQADSVIAMLMLDSEQGSYIDLEVTGPDEEQALAAIIQLFQHKLEDD
ncbi:MULTISPECIES: PTS phosphocarrier protein NPr [Arsenophonus]|jgi:phosphocarrier protein NPr|uniref:PTS phosphocarrier protein NPr n=1 Tax=Arsenophonus TaxID=637 RepID=UPI0015D7D348|nr:MULTISPECIES: PTS phosphocarrier protein NPr [Arsenophonus]UBX28861.1 PTS phosphocarrier protein NPr [Arsenophonus apicola]